MKGILSDFSSALKLEFRVFKETYKDFRLTRSQSYKISNNSNLSNVILDELTIAKIEEQKSLWKSRVHEKIKEDLNDIPPLNNSEISLHNRKELENLMISGK